MLTHQVIISPPPEHIYQYLTFAHCETSSFTWTRLESGRKEEKKRTGCEAGDLTLTLELLTASWSRNLSSSAWEAECWASNCCLASCRARLPSSSHSCACLLASCQGKESERRSQHWDERAAERAGPEREVWSLPALAGQAEAHAGSLAQGPSLALMTALMRIAPLQAH